MLGLVSPGMLKPSHTSTVPQPSTTSLTIEDAIPTLFILSGWVGVGEESLWHIFHEFMPLNM